MIAAVAVVVPAHDEQRLIGACLRSVRRAALYLSALHGSEPHLRALALPVTVVVVADSCHDRTVQVARGQGAQVIEVECRSAGASRALGTAHALELIRAHPSAPADQRIWLAHTDADSLVPETWLGDQLAHAAAGAHAVAGLVQVQDWSGHSVTTADRYRRHYDRRPQIATADPADPLRQGRLHPHVHGANLGVRADAYLAVGGFPHLPVGEDHALVTALERADHRVHASSDPRVVTSARRDPRARGGFGHFLLDLESRSSQLSRRGEG